MKNLKINDIKCKYCNEIMVRVKSGPVNKGGVRFECNNLSCPVIFVLVHKDERIEWYLESEAMINGN